MEEKELRELLRERLHFELQLFKDSMLRKPKEDIYGDSYKTEVFINLYEIFVEEAEVLDMETMRELLYRKYGILESFYRDWLEQEDAFRNQLWAWAGGELEAIAQETVAGRREMEDGEKSGQAA